MPLIKVQLLGPPELWVDGDVPPPAVRWRKNLGLCILLWNSPGRRVSRELAMSMLWGDREERDARHSLNEALRVLRKSVAIGAIDSSGDVLQWQSPIALDCDAFLALQDQDPVGAAQLIRGGWCEGFTVPEAAEFDRWLDDERRRWRHRLVAVLAAAAERSGDAGDLKQARTYAELADRLDPLSEVAARAVIRTHALAGDRSAALAEAEAFSLRLHEELGVGIGNETALLLRRVSESRSRKPSTAHTEARAEIPFVGREATMDRLLKALRTAQRDRHGALLLVDGEPGAGRTRVLDEVQLRAALEGYLVLTVRAVPADASRAGGGLRAIAESGLAELPGAAAIGADAMATLVATSSAWAERFGAGTVERPMSLEDALIAAFRSVASERALLLSIDDLDAFDLPTVSWISVMLRALRALPVVVLATLAVGDTRRELDALRRHVGRPAHGDLLRVNPLAHDHLLHAVQGVLPAWDVTAHERLTRRLMAESGGLPAVAFGVLEAVVRGLSLEELTGTWPQQDRTLDATLPSRIPDALTAAIRLRFHQLEETERTVLTLLAVEAAPLRADRLAALVGIEGGGLEPNLDALEWDGWLTADARGYRFRARAVGTLVATEMLTAGQRRRLQERLGAD